MCYNPLYAILTKYKGSQSVKIIPKNLAEKYKNGTFSKADTLMSMKINDTDNISIIELPCGNCLQCRLDYARKWADRLSIESLSYNNDEKWFLTLTYDNDNINENLSTKKENIYSLNKRDLQLFMKRLRKSYEELFAKHGLSATKLRFFAAGEYGDISFRPHYHIIIFGLKFQDLQLYKVSSQNFNYYISPWLNSIWQKGFVVVANATWQTFNYVSRYIMKKHKGQSKSFYGELGIEPEFCTMSTKPGLGNEYFYKNYKKVYEHDEIYFNDLDKGGMTCRPP